MEYEGLVAVGGYDHHIKPLPFQGEAVVLHLQKELLLDPMHPVVVIGEGDHPQQYLQARKKDQEAFDEGFALMPSQGGTPFPGYW